MTIQDPIADMLTRVRNAQMVGKSEVTMAYSTQKEAIANVLKEQGFLAGHKVDATNAGKKEIVLMLKYHNDQPVIESLRRVSKPSLRIYKRRDQLPEVLGGLGVAIISTSKGVMTAKQARKLGLGGEILCYVS